MIAHLAQDFIKDPQFCTSIFRHNPGLGRRVVQELQKYVETFMDKLKGRKSSNRATAFLKGEEALNSMRESLATAYATMMHREGSAAMTREDPPGLTWPKDKQGNNIITLPNIPVSKTPDSGRREPHPGLGAEANQGWSPRGYTTVQERTRAKRDANITSGERFNQVTDLWDSTRGEANEEIARLAIDYSAQNHKNVSFRTTVESIFNDPKLVKHIDFGAYAFYHLGAADASIPGSHAHHIAYKKWFESQAPLVKQIHGLMREAGINPIVGLENLIHAPNIKGQHNTVKLQLIADALRKTKLEGGEYLEFVQELNEMGQAARNHRIPPSDKSKTKTKPPK
jgi:hypothetical protein